jgi:hypothetical protein
VPFISAPNFYAVNAVLYKVNVTGKFTVLYTVKYKLTVVPVVSAAKSPISPFVVT